MTTENTDTTINDATATVSTPKARNSSTSWPTSHYTFDELQAMNPTIVPITLRCRNANHSDVYVIGRIKKPGVGRPKDVYVIGTPTETVLETAKSAGVDVDTPVKLKKTTKPVAVQVTTASAPTITSEVTETVASVPEVVAEVANPQAVEATDATPSA